MLACHWQWWTILLVFLDERYGAGGLISGGQEFGIHCRKGALRQVAHQFTAEKRWKVIDTINEPRFADLPPGQIVAILAEEQR
jgi:hypothetical protein